MNRRRARRWPRQFEARLWKAGEERPFSAIITNFSVTGLFVRTPNVAPAGTRFRIEVIHSTGGFMMEAVVARTIKTPPSLQGARPSGMGLRFLGPLELLEELLPGVMLAGVGERAAPVGSGARRAGRSVPTLPPNPSPAPSGMADRDPGPSAPEDRLFRITYRSREHFRTVFENDIQTGGLFVPVARPPQLGEVVVVEASIDGIVHSGVRVEGRVVHRMEAQPGEQAEGDLLSGMGLQLTDIPGAIERLRGLLGD